MKTRSATHLASICRALSWYLKLGRLAALGLRLGYAAHSKSFSDRSPATQGLSRGGRTGSKYAPNAMLDDLSIVPMPVT